MTTSFWAQLERPDPENQRRRIVQSPTFAAQLELFAWIKSHQIAGDNLCAWRREQTDAGFTDHDLMTSDEPRPQPEKLAEILATAKAALDVARRNSRMKPSPSERERGAAARERLDKAGREAKAQEAV